MTDGTSHDSEGWRGLWKRRCTWRTLIVAALLAYGCGPKIKSFELAPITGGARASSGVVQICAGEAVAATWKAKGEVGVALRLGDPRFATREEGEEADLAAPDTLEVTLVASKGSKEVVRTTLVLQHPAVSRDVVGFDISSLQGDTLLAAGDKQSSSGERFRIATVESGPGRALQVRHGGRSAQLGANERSGAFEGLPLDGRWELRTALTAAELATPGLRPLKLRVNVTLSCRGGAS